MKIAIIIPTYQEAGAIGALLDELALVFSHAPEHVWSVVVVDAHSPDGTADIVRQKATQHGNIQLIVEAQKRGIAAAYLTGMEAAVRAGADAFVEFDGDGQHDPYDLLRFADAAQEGADYVIGSRYVPGGSIPQSWAPHRKFLSRFGSLYIRLMLAVPVHDTTSGFKLTRVVPFYTHLPHEEGELLSRQYAYKIQFLYTMFLFGAKIREVPIVFRAREHDTSKSTWRDIIESLRVTILLRLGALEARDASIRKSSSPRNLS